MASIAIDGDALHLRLSWLEKLGALHGDVVVPRSCVRSARTSEAPMREVRGLRAPGTAIPFVIGLGTFRTFAWKDFVAVTSKPGLVIELDGAPFRRLVVSTPDAAALADQLSGSSHALT